MATRTDTSAVAIRETKVATHLAISPTLASPPSKTTTPSYSGISSTMAAETLESKALPTAVDGGGGSIPTAISFASTNRRTANDVRMSGTHTQPSGTAAGSFQAERPTGTPRCIVRIDRDHDLADESTRFECEQFPEEFVDRVSRPEFKATVLGINECMRDAEESALNCLDTILDCLTAYTAKYCLGTHYQRAMRRMEDFIALENKRLYHPARMHLRDPQTVGMIYLEFEIF